MKQGTGKEVRTGRKAEPASHGVNQGATHEIGIHHFRYKSKPLYEGRGIEAPMKSQKTSKSGSQGNY